MRLAVIAGALRGSVAISENQCDARRVLRRTGVDRLDRTLSDRGLNHEAIQHALLLRLIGVTRPAGNLQSTVHAVERFSDNALLIEGVAADG